MYSALFIGHIEAVIVRRFRVLIIAWIHLELDIIVAAVEGNIFQTTVVVALFLPTVHSKVLLILTQSVVRELVTTTAILIC
jgi:hypothetical protein